MAMLTPNKIKGYQFQQAGRGTYKSEEVDDFFGQVVQSYEQVFKENGELVKKLSILATKLDEYRKEETSVRKALMNAQTFIDKMVEDAGKESKRIIAEAQERARNVDSITNAKIKVMVDEVEGKMRIAYDKATSQARQTKENAEKEAETILLEAQEKAERIVSSARREAETIISGATTNALKDAETLRAEIEKEKELLDSIKATSNQFKKELVVLYERQIKTVEQMPDFKLDKKLEEDFKAIIGENVESSEEVKNIVESFVENDDNYFDADDLIREYAVKDEKADDGFVFAFDFDDEDDAQENAEDVFSFDLDEEEIEAIEKEVEDTVEKEISEDIEKKEAEIEAEIEAEVEKELEEISEEEISEDADEDEYEDVFSDSGNSESFRFTAEDLAEINREREEGAEKTDSDDVDIFSEENDDGGIPITRTERQRKFDIAFSDDDAVKIEKDKELFLNQTESVEEEEEKGFKFFDNIDVDENEVFTIKIDDEEEAEADDVFGKPDEDDDSEGFSFLKNLFGKNKD